MNSGRATESPPGAGRLQFIDGMRGIALILMVVNHTSRDWMDVGMGWARYHLVYGSLLLPPASLYQGTTNRLALGPFEIGVQPL